MTADGTHLAWTHNRLLRILLLVQLVASTLFFKVLVPELFPCEGTQ
jgi:hypothetical protein